MLARTAEPEQRQSPGMLFALGRCLNACTAAPRGLRAAPGKGQSCCSPLELEAPPSLCTRGPAWLPAGLGADYGRPAPQADFLRPSNKCGFVCFVFKEHASFLWWGAQESGSRRMMIPHQEELGCAGKGKGTGGPARAAPRSLTALPKQLFIPLAEGPLRTVPVCTGLPSPFTQGESVQHCPWLQASHEQHKSFPPVGAGKMGGAGVPLSAGPHAPGSTSSRGSCARGVSCVAWQGGSRPVRLSASTGRACGALTCPGSPPGTCGDRDGAEPPPQHPSSFPAPATAAHHSPRAATASFRTSLFLSSRGLASARITLAL